MVTSLSRLAPTDPAVIRLRAYLAAEPPLRRTPRPTVPMSAYGDPEGLQPGERAGPDAPGPQPWNAGITPGLPPPDPEPGTVARAVADVYSTAKAMRDQVDELAFELRILRDLLAYRTQVADRLEARLKELEEDVSSWTESGLTREDLRALYSPPASADTAAASRSTAPAASAGTAITRPPSRSCTLRPRSTPAVALAAGT